MYYTKIVFIIVFQIFTLIFLLISNLHSQDRKWDNLIVEIENDIRQDKHSTAYTKISELLKLSQSEFGESHINTARSFENAGIIYMKLNIFPRAVFYFKSAIKVYNISQNIAQIIDPDKLNNLNMLYSRALFKMGNYELANINYQDLVKNYSESKNNIFQKESLYMDIGNINMKMKNLQIAKTYFSAGLNLLKDKNLSNSEEYIKGIFNFSNVNLLLEDYSTALIQLRNSINILENTYNNDILLAQAYEKYANIYYNLGNQKASKEYFEKSYGILLNLNGQKSRKSRIFREKYSTFFENSNSFSNSNDLMPSFGIAGTIGYHDYFLSSYNNDYRVTIMTGTNISTKITDHLFINYQYNHISAPKIGGIKEDGIVVGSKYYSESFHNIGLRLQSQHYIILQNTISWFGFGLSKYNIKDLESYNSRSRIIGGYYFDDPEQVYITKSSSHGWYVESGMMFSNISSGFNLFRIGYSINVKYDNDINKKNNLGGITLLLGAHVNIHKK